MGDRRRGQLALRPYLVAITCVRALLTLLPLSYIHPDEFFQSQEPMARVVLGQDAVVLPWEWDVDSAESGGAGQRTVVIPFLVSGVPFSLLRLLFGSRPPPALLLFAPRVVMLAASLVVDVVVDKVCAAYSRDKSVARLVTGVGSWVSVVFLGRPFSNSVESIVLAAVYGVALLHPKTPKKYYSIGALSALGVFNRFTFVLFVLPLVFALIVENDLGRGGVRERARNAAVVLLRCAAAGACMSAAIVACDTAFYGRLTVTPLNNALYNTRVDNLAKHGLHPRYLHALVNFPMLFGPAGVAMLLGARGSRRSVVSPAGLAFDIGRVCWWGTLVPLVLLSLAPHQEARFLIPLLLPVGLACAPATARKSRRSGCVGSPWWRRAVLAHCVALVVFWGVLHQGGLVRACLRHLRGGAVPRCIVFARTYMPPRFLAAENVTVIDSSSATVGDAVDAGYRCSGGAGFSMVLPASVPTSGKTLPEFVELDRLWPHFSTEDPPKDVWQATLRVLQVPPLPGRGR